MKNRKGFTIIEIIAAMAIFAIAILGIGALLVFNIKYSKINEEREVALYKANKVLEHLISLNYTDLCLTIGTDDTCENDTGSCCDGFAGDKSVRWIVNLGTSPDTKEITVIATFTYQNYTGNVTLNYIKGNW